MALATGTRLGVYEIAVQIGEGGMGAVYRARDTKLNRDVALKVLPDSFARDPDRLARFTREAQTLASLNHPNIAHIHGFEDSGDVRALVMELIEGEDLSQRIARGPLPFEEALPIAKQIADALEAAHEQGIIHRDLKPANIKVRDDGTVKVLDFGLAKMLEAPGGSPDASISPTIAVPGATRMGVILGTAAYMSPEQARGKFADRRSDVWAFGCVLFEMLTGTRTFAGTEIADVLAAVVRDEPDWNRLPGATPTAIRRLLRRALKKDRRQRLADVADARLELEEAIHEGPSRAVAVVNARRRAWRDWVWPTIAIVSLLVIVGIGIGWMRMPQADVRVVQFDIAPPAGGIADWSQPLSPDGRTVAFIAGGEGKSQIWVRPLDAAAARSLPGTDGATRAFWSPDSQHVAFFVEGNLKEVGMDGRAARSIARGPFRDGAWSPGGVVLVGGQLGQPLMRVAEVGGEPVAETALDSSRGEVSHDYPEFLPDGLHYVYVARRGVRTDDFSAYVGTLGSTERKELPGIRAAVKYSATGHLLFLRGNRLMAQAFSLDRLELSGDAFPIAEQAMGGRVASFSISANGTLAYSARLSPEARLVWFDRTGRQLGPAGPIATYENLALAPDGRSVAFDRGSPADIWLLALESGGARRLTTDRSDDRRPTWSPDGQTLAFTSNRGGAEGLYLRTLSSGSDDRLVIKSDVPILLSDWSRDGKYVTYAASGDLWAVPLAGDRTPLQLTATPLLQEYEAMFSPDGRWIAYQSDASSGITRSGEGDIFVQSFPERGFTRQVSTTGGFVPRWSDDGKELFYLTPDSVLMAVTMVARGSTIEISTPRSLFRVPVESVSRSLGTNYGVSKDGRFLIRLPASELSITVILNWFEQLKRVGSTNPAAR